MDTEIYPTAKRLFDSRIDKLRYLLDTLGPCIDSSSPPTDIDMSKQKTKPTMHHWGPGLAVVEDGQLTDVLPHPDDPDPSRINENILAGVYGSARVLRPAVRKSYLEKGPGLANERRGEDAFVEVDFDTALDLIANELKRLRLQFGSQSIFAGSYGWASGGRFHHAQSQLKRFLNCSGGFIRSEGNYSYNAALVLMPHIVS